MQEQKAYIAGEIMEFTLENPHGRPLSIEAIVKGLLTPDNDNLDLTWEVKLSECTKAELSILGYSLPDTTFHYRLSETHSILTADKALAYYMDIIHESDYLTFLK